VESIASVGPRVLRQMGVAGEMPGWRAVQDWPRLVGDRVARHSRAVSFRDGTLHVEVEGSAWMHELGFLKRDLIAAINRHLGSDPVRDIRWSVPRGGILR
jgi:predicted nucleic acid-binding Zn ribbon protein